MDSGKGTLDTDMAKRSDVSVRCSETRTFAQKTKRWRWILQNDWPVPTGLIISRLRDRWFKSSPRNQFLRGMLREQLFFCTESGACPARMAKQEYAPRHLKRSSVAQW